MEFEDVLRNIESLKKSNKPAVDKLCEHLIDRMNSRYAELATVASEVTLRQRQGAVQELSDLLNVISNSSEILEQFLLAQESSKLEKEAHT